MTPHPISLTISPSDPALDTLLRIRAAGCGPGAIVAITTSQLDPGGHWRASASFVADDDGVVDTTSDAPLAGSYDGFDAMGLVWSMTAVDGSPDGERAGPLDPVRLTVTARTGDGPIAVAVTGRACLPAGVTRISMHGPGVVGALFHPEDGGPHPGVLLLGGAQGGLLHEADAALLAAHGFGVLALASFGVDRVPGAVVDLPLEAFGTAIELMLAHPAVRGDRIGVLGRSRGGEAALLIGATFPRVGAVVSVVGSGLATAGIRPGVSLPDMLHPFVGSWTWRGSAIAHLRNAFDRELLDQVESGEPVELGHAYRLDLFSGRDLAAAAIPVERIRGPVLLLSATDDRLWPSTELSEIALRRLERHGHRSPFLHVRYPDAGHAITSPPYGPTQLVVTDRGIRFAMGGTIPATAKARADAWLRTIEWFAEHLPA